MGRATAMDQQTELVERTAAIVAAYVRGNSVATSELPQLIIAVHSALSALSSRAAAGPDVELSPAVPIKKSVTPEYIICLEDGKKFKSLKRHLRTSGQMGFAGRLPHGRAELCAGALRSRQTDGPGHERPQ
jgi:predicted transcriptional regulator